MRKSSKILAILFLVVAAGLVFFVTKQDETEIEAAVEARLVAATAEREQALEQAYAERERALADTLAAREAAITMRLAALDSALARVEAPVFSRLNTDRVEGVLRRMGLAYEQGTDAQDDPMFSFKLATYLTHIYFYGCEAEGCTSLRIGTCFNMNAPPAVERLNDWNKTKRFSTAYRNDNDFICLDHDLILQGGVTLDALEAFIINFRNRLTEYAAHIDF